MKPGMITAKGMGHADTERLVRWLNANGLRHYVPEFARIIFTGNRLIVPTFDMERVGQKNKAWAKRRFTRDADGGITGLPVKIRAYRVRVPFEAIK